MAHEEQNELWVDVMIFTRTGPGVLGADPSPKSSKGLMGPGGMKWGRQVSQSLAEHASMCNAVLFFFPGAMSWWPGLMECFLESHDAP